MSSDRPLVSSCLHLYQTMNARSEKHLPHRNDSRAVSALLLVARFIIGLFGLLLGVFGVATILSSLGEHTWWVLILGLVCFGCGVSFMWIAFKGKRDDLCEIVRVLKELLSNV